MFRIEHLDRVYIHAEVADQVLHDSDDCVMGSQQFLLMARVDGILNGFVQGILEVSHAVHRTHGIGLLEVTILRSHDATDMFEFRRDPTHQCVRCLFVLVRR